MSSQEHSRTAACNRRIFLAGLSCAATALLLPESGTAVPAGAAATDTLLCLGSFGQDDSGTIHFIAMCNGQCERLSSARTERPLALATHPVEPIVYVANGVEQYRHEPRGTVEAFLVDQNAGRLQLLARQPLSLSATDPRALAVAPDGRSLLVAAFSGGAYNVLPLDPAGVPGAPSTILKLVGRGSDSGKQASAHPAAVLFHPREGWAVAADFGADRLDFLSAEPATQDGRRLMVKNRMQCKLESAPSRLALHREGRLMVAMHRREPTLASFRVTASGAFTRLRELALDSAATAMEFHPQQDVLYVTMRESARVSRLEAWQIDPAAGSFIRAGALTLPVSDIRTLVCTTTALWLASDRGLLVVALDAFSASPRTWELAAAIPGSSALTVVRGIRV